MVPDRAAHESSFLPSLNDRSLSLSLSHPQSTVETDDSDIKIADFGFAKRIADLLPKETACGTPGYVAPEILRGDRYGAEVDIWR